MSPIPVPEEALERAERFREVLRVILPQGFDVAVGLKETGGEVTDTLSLRVYVFEKRPQSEIPEEEMIPEEFEGVPVDVVESRRYLIADVARYDPLRGGIEISRPATIINPIMTQHHSGTLGVVVRRTSDSSLMLLTCEHVSGPPTTDTMQPGTLSSVSEVVGRVITTDPDLDCALIEPNARRGLSSSIQDVGPVAGIGPFPAVDQAVKKRGRTTLLTRGTIRAVFPRQIPGTGKKWRVFDIAPDPAGSIFCDRGDSGAALLNDSDEVVGLVFAMDTDASGHPIRGIATAMEDIRNGLSIAVATGALSTPPPFPGRLLRYPPLTVGADVETWQRRMVERGHGIGIDGKYGSASKAACKVLQEEKGLDQDGVVGELTWDATFQDD